MWFAGFHTTWLIPITAAVGVGLVILTNLILLPIWISAYRYMEKVFRFLVNGRTGEVQGERPYSWIKITLFVLTILAAIGGIVALVASGKG